MQAPVSRLKKTEVEWLSLHRCKRHGHTYLTHYSCYLTEQSQKQRIGFFDIETSNFKADWAIVLSYSILDDENGAMYGRSLRPKELANGTYDKALLAEMVRDLKRFDLIVGFYSTKFDIPFARTRAIINGGDFPLFGEIQHKDVYYAVKEKFGALSSRRQENAAKMLVGKTEKTHINPKIWMNALISHDKSSLAWILDHNRRDVRDLKDIYHVVLPFIKNSTKSI